MKRTPLVLLVAIGLLLATGATAAAKLTSKNSFPSFAAGSKEVFSGSRLRDDRLDHEDAPGPVHRHRGPRARSSATATNGGGTQVTAVTVAGTAITITVLADGPPICDPAQTGYPPDEPSTGRPPYDFRAEYTRRVQATIRVYYESYIFGAKWRMRPKTIHDSRAGAAPGERVTGIRWKRFGGRKAIGYGRLRQDYCRAGDNCPQNGKRIRLVAEQARLLQGLGQDRVPEARRLHREDRVVRRDHQVLGLTAPLTGSSIE